jgi:hypothetical protein
MYRGTLGLHNLGFCEKKSIFKPISNVTSPGPRTMKNLMVTFEVYVAIQIINFCCVVTGVIVNFCFNAKCVLTKNVPLISFGWLQEKITLLCQWDRCNFRLIEVCVKPECNECMVPVECNRRKWTANTGLPPLPSLRKTVASHSAGFLKAVVLSLSQFSSIHAYSHTFDVYILL